MAKKIGYDFNKIFVSTTGVVLLFLILILINVIISYAKIRWDVTENKSYTLSQGTKNILSKVTVPITIKFFYSKSNPNFPTDLKSYANRVKEFLTEYENASNEQITVQVYDPKIDSDEEESAEEYRMRAMYLPTGDKIYCGLTFLSGDRLERIEWLDPSADEVLEYDITRRIQNFQTPKKKKVGIVSALPVFGGKPTARALFEKNAAQKLQPWFFVKELKKTYEVQEIYLSADQIDPSIDLLLIVHPKEFHPDLRYAIDQYILSGRNAIVFVDPICISQGYKEDSFMEEIDLLRSLDRSSSLNDLFSKWGISFDKNKVVVDLDQSTRILTDDNISENSPVVITPRSKAFNKFDLITSRLESMLLPVVGAIIKNEDSPYEFGPLIQSGENATLIDSDKAYLAPEDLLREVVGGGKRLNIAVKISGKFKTAFPEGPPPVGNPGKNNLSKNHLQIGRKKSTIIVVADADLVADDFSVRKGTILGKEVYKLWNDNLNFISNACEILSGSEDLIGLRTRKKFERPFTVVLELERRAQERWLTKQQELLNRIKETNQRLKELEKQKGSEKESSVSPGQKAEIEKFKEERRRINKELKEVHKNLRAEVEALGTTLKGINIFLMPFCVAMMGIGFGIYRRRRIKKK